MIRTNKWNLLASSTVILLPVLFGLIFWNELPQQMATHWGVDGRPNGWSSRGVAVFVIPLVLLALHWLCVLVTAVDPKNKGQNPKIFGLVLWITPMISLVTNAMIYAAALDKDVQPFLPINLLMGAMFVVIGNYLPKCKQNRTIGIKVKWALESEENWNATHRFGGKVWVIGGLLLMPCGLLPGEVSVWTAVCAALVLSVIPTLYSYWYHKKQRKNK